MIACMGWLPVRLHYPPIVTDAIPQMRKPVCPAMATVVVDVVPIVTIVWVRDAIVRGQGLDDVHRPGTWVEEQITCNETKIVASLDFSTHLSLLLQKDDGCTHGSYDYNAM